MRFSTSVLLAILVQASAAFGFHDNGHSVIAHLAYLKLTPQQRTAVIEILKKHPHYAEYLNADRPNHVNEEQWVFWRAATWADWIKKHHTHEFSHPTWHYINLPYVPPHSQEDASAHPPEEPNVVTKTKEAMDKAKSESDAAKRAVWLTWLFHLMGDLGQPLHSATMFTEDFQEGDRGGNDARFRLPNGTIINVHSFWDSTLGNKVTRTSVPIGANKALEVASHNGTQIAGDLAAHTTVDSWAQEGLAAAVQFAYLNGSLEPANAHDDPEGDEVPEVPDSYATDAARVCRIGAVKMGERLAVAIQDVVQ